MHRLGPESGIVTLDSARILKLGLESSVDERCVSSEGVGLCAMTIGTGTAMAARRGLWSSTIRGKDSKVAWEG